MFGLTDEAFARVASWMSCLSDSSPFEFVKEGSVDSMVQEYAVESSESDVTLASDGGIKETKHFFSLLSVVGVDRVEEKRIGLDTVEKVTRGFE